VLLLTHAQLGAAAAERGGGEALSDLFQHIILYTLPPPMPPPMPPGAAAAAAAPPGAGAAAAALHALLLAPQRRFRGKAHACTVRLPRAEDAPPAALSVHARAPAPAPQQQPREEPAPQPQPHAHAEPPQPQPQRWAEADDGGDDGGFARLLVATSARGGVLRAWPALRDAVLRLEGRCGASVAERELACGDEGASDAPSRLLRCPDALFLGAAGAVWALRVLRGTVDHALLAAAAAPPCAPQLGAALRALGARCNGLVLVVVCSTERASSSAAAQDDDALARAAAPRAAALAGAAAAAGLPLRVRIAVGDAAGRDASLAPLCAAAAPPDAPPRLRALPDAPPPGEALLRCCAGLNALSAHALLCSGMSLATLLRTDLTDAISVAAAAATGGVFLSARALAAFDAFRAMPLGGALQLPAAQAGGSAMMGEEPCAQMYEAVLDGGAMGMHQHSAQMQMQQQMQQQHMMQQQALDAWYAEQVQHAGGPVPQAPSWAPPYMEQVAPMPMPMPMQQQQQQQQAWEEAQAAAARAAWQSAPAAPGGWREARALVATGSWPPPPAPPPQQPFFAAAAPPAPQPPQFVNPYGAPPPAQQQQQYAQEPPHGGSPAPPRRRVLDDVDFLFEEEEEPAAWMLPPPPPEQQQQQQLQQEYMPQQQHGAPPSFAEAYAQQMQQQMQQQQMPPPATAHALPFAPAPAPLQRTAATSARSASMGRGGAALLGVGGTREGAQLDDLLGAWLAKARVHVRQRVLARLRCAVLTRALAAVCAQRGHAGAGPGGVPCGGAAGGPHAPPPPRARSSVSDDSDDLRGFLAGLDGDEAQGGARDQQQQQRSAPHRAAMPASSAGGSRQHRPPPPPLFRAPRLDAFRYEEKEQEEADEFDGGADIGDAGDAMFAFAPHGGAPKRLRLAPGPADNRGGRVAAAMSGSGGSAFGGGGGSGGGGGALSLPMTHSPAGSAAAAAAAAALAAGLRTPSRGAAVPFALGGARFAPGAPGAHLPALPPPPPSPARPRGGGGALTASPEAKKKLNDILQKLGAPRRGGGGGGGNGPARSNKRF
jgi:uncharacterized membrane protein YgcG